MRRGLVALALLAVSCAVASSRATTSQTAAAPTAPPTRSPAPAPIREMRVTVNGRAYALGEPAYVDEAGPITVRLSFPVAMDHPSVENAVRTDWARSGSTVDAQLRWPDDGTLELVTARTLPFVVSPAGGRTADRERVVDVPALPIVVASEHELSFYRSFELVSGKSSPRTYRVRFDSAFSVSADGKRALVYTAARQPAGPLPYLLDLTTGARRPLALPSDERRFAYAGWLNDGRILAVGTKVWLAGPDGESPRALTDASSDAAGAWLAVPSPLSRSVAIWLPPETLAIVDLATGARRELDLAFHRCAADAPVGLTWSPNGTLLAASHCPHEDLSGVTRIVDAATGREVRSVPVVGMQLALLSDGGLLALRPVAGCKTCTGTESSVLVVDLDGTVTRSYDAVAMYVAPGGALLYIQRAGQAPAADLVELASDKSIRLQLPGPAFGWTRQSELVVLR